MQLLCIFRVGYPIISADVDTRTFKVYAVLFRHHDRRSVTVISGMFAGSLPDAQSFFRRLADDVDENHVSLNAASLCPVRTQ